MALPEAYAMNGDSENVLAPPTRELIEVVRFKAFYQSLMKGTRGDYKLLLGIPFQQKDAAWMLSDYDGRMLEIVASTLKLVGGS